MRKTINKRVIMRLNIPPLQNHCMSSCNFAKIMSSSFYCICSDTSARTSNPILLFLFEVNVILGFFISSLNLRFMIALFSLLFFFFNFLFSLCNSPCCRVALSCIALSNLFCSFLKLMSSLAFS